MPRRRAGRKRASGRAAASAWAASATRAPSSASEGRPTTTTTLPGADQPPGLGQGVGVDAVGGGAPAAVAPGPGDQVGGLARAVAEGGGGVRGERGGLGRQLDHGQVAVDDGRPQAEEEDGELLAEVAGQQRSTVSAAAAWSMVARGRPRTTSAGRPSPSWASTESVPSTPLASLAQA